MAAEELAEGLLAGEVTWRVVAEEMRQLQRTFGRELKSIRVFALKRDDAWYFDKALDAFGQKAVDVFPSAVPEIDEAGKCIALGRAPAAVFHLMRIAEIGLRALAPLVGITDPNPDWGAVIRKIDEEVKLPKKQRTLSADYDFLAGVSNHMHAVKLTLSALDPESAASSCCATVS